VSHSRHVGCGGVLWQITVLAHLALDRIRCRTPNRTPGNACEHVGCRAFGAHDLEREGRDELEIADETPASGVVAAVYRLVGLRLLKLRARRTGRDSPMEFLHIDGGTESSWVVCRDSRRGRQVVQVGQGYVPDHHRVDVSETSYALKGLLFRHVSTRTYSRRGAKGFPLRGRGRLC